MLSATLRPLSLSGGANCNGVVGLDWVQLGGHESKLSEAAAVLERYFGPRDTSKPVNRPLWFHQLRWEFPGGAMLLFGHEAGVCTIVVSGGALGTLEASRRVDLVRELFPLGFKAKRCDIAIDLIDLGVDLVGNLAEAVRAGQVVRSPTGSCDFAQRGSVEVKACVTVGLKGDAGSGRQFQIYDKGIEQRQSKGGEWFEDRQWQRLEGRYWDERAQEVLCALLDAGPDWVAPAVAFVLGAVDLRENNGAKYVRDRPRLRWFEDLCAWCGTLRTSAGRRLASLASRVEWLRKAVKPGLAALAEAVGSTVSDVLDLLAGDVSSTQTARRSLVVQQFREFAASGDLSLLMRGPTCAMA